MSGPEAVERLVAEAEIRNVVARLSQLADHGDLGEYLSLWCEDGTWEHTGLGDLRTGHGELLAGAEERRRDAIQGPGTATRHMIVSHWVQVHGPDDASSEAYYLLVGAHDPAHPVLLRTGRYRDTFRRTATGWKLAGRVIEEKPN